MAHTEITQTLLLVRVSRPPSHRRTGRVLNGGRATAAALQEAEAAEELAVKAYLKRCPSPLIARSPTSPRSNARPAKLSSDLRPAIVLDHAADVAINGLGAQGNSQAGSEVRLLETQDVLLTAVRVLSPAAAFLQVEGASSRGITIDGGDLSKTSVPVVFKAGANQTAVKLRM